MPPITTLISEADKLVSIIRDDPRFDGSDEWDRVFPWYEFRDLNDAIAAVRAQETEDAKPVDQEWLLSIGFVSDGLSLRMFGLLAFYPAPGTWWIGGRQVETIKSRGDVLRLLTALGIRP